MSASISCVFENLIAYVCFEDLSCIVKIAECIACLRTKECALRVQKQAKDLRFANYTAPMVE